MGRLAPLSGLAGVLMVIVSFAVLGGDTPGSEDSGAVVNAFYDAHQGREMAASIVLAAAAPFLVIFAISLALALWPAEGMRSALWQLTLAAGGAVAGAAFVISGMLQFAVTDAADQSSVGGATLQALNVLTADSWVAFNAGLGVMMLGAAGTLLSRKAMPVLGWIALAAGIALFIPFADFVGLIVTGLWIIATSVLLYRRGAGLAPAVA
jgi:hypothetical protein